MTGPEALAPERLRPPTRGELRRLWRAYGLHPRRGLSQNFLTDGAALDAIVEAADLTPGERVVEIGPGLGVLTRRLLAAGCQVVAVELDGGLVDYLRQELGGIRAFSLVQADALSVSPATIFPGESYKLVANIPYHITSPLLHLFLGADRPPRLSVLLVQREVAERVAAPAGQLSYLSVFVQNVARARVVAIVPAAAFEPAPEVDSAILRLEARPAPVVAAGHGHDVFQRVVQAGFRQRRKQVHNALARELPLSRDDVDAALASCAVDPERRPQTLTVEEWSCLAARFGPLLGSTP